MPQGRTTRLQVCLTPAERQTLQTWQRSLATPSGYARRARIILLLADGLSITRVAALVGMSRRCVYKWARRYLRQGLHGLVDLPRHVPAHRQWMAEEPP